MFGATNIAKDSDISKWVYSDSGKAFDGKGEWGFFNHSAVVIFSVDNRSSSHTDNCKIDFLVFLGEGDTFGVSGSFDVLEKKLVLILVKQRQNFA